MNMQILVNNINSLEKCMDCEKPFFMDIVRWNKIQSIKSESDKKRSFASGYLLHQMCKELGIDNPEYGYSEKGKPYLIGDHNVSFNISHSGDYVVLAYQESPQPIGIDIQQIRNMREGMKRKILHEKEQVPENASTEEQTRYLNRIWSIKESYVKMTGDGLSCDFRRIQIDFKNHKIMTENGDAASFVEYEKLDGYVMAVCGKDVLDLHIKGV